MKKINLILCLLGLAGLYACQSPDGKDWKELQRNFRTPPESARPGVYWYFMDGNISKEGMTKDLEAMKRAGIGSVVFLEVNVGIPRGNVDFLSDEWKECFRHAVKECERLGISMTLGIGPGWTGSGGPWVAAEQSMRHLVASSTVVKGSGRQTVKLPEPSPKAPYFGEGAFTPELKEKWAEYYEDVAVLAFPTPGEMSRIKDVGEKALYYRAPYSSVPGVKQYLPREKSMPSGRVVNMDEVIDLTSLLQEDGSITWEVPSGNWTVMRFGLRNNGAVTRPAPLPGVGFECDKTDTAAIAAHFKVFTDELLRVVGERDTTLPGGLKMLHMDSWEMGAQNWAPGLREEFRRRRGYDPQPYYPAYDGYIVGSREISERFLWDLRQTMQELMLENHALYVKEYAHRRGMKLSIEPYDMNPMQDLELGASADIPMCEFWSPGGYNTSFSAIEGSSSRGWLETASGLDEEPDGLGFRRRDQQAYLPYIPAPGAARQPASGYDDGAVRRTLGPQPDMVAVRFGVSHLRLTVPIFAAERTDGSRHTLSGTGRSPVRVPRPGILLGRYGRIHA